MPNELRDNILIVEDDPGTALLQQRHLARAGFSAHAVSTAEAAVREIKAQDFSVIVVDQNLPGELNGLELCTRLKAEGCELPIVMVTANSDESTVIEAIRLGVRDFVVKRPDYLSYLAPSVTRVLAQAKFESQLRQSRRPRNRGGVLIIEDDEGVAHLQRRQLERAGYKISVAHTPEQGFERVRQGGISLILLDQRLSPTATGLSFYQELKNAGFEIPAMLVTGYSDESTAIEALRIGVRDFVPKSANYLSYLPGAIERVFERVRLEAELLESRARLASMVGSAMDAIVSIDSEFCIDLFNAAAERIFQVPSTDALGKPVEAFFPHLFKRSEQGVRPLFENPQGVRSTTFSGETLGLRADGREFPAEVSVSESEVLGSSVFTIIARDISERKHMEEELRRRAEELAEAGCRKDEFVAMLAHELRNPLAPVGYALQILEHRGDDPNVAQEMRGMMERQIKHMSRLIDDLLDVSRIARGKVRVKRERLDIVQLAGTSLNDNRAAIESAGLRLSLLLPDHPVWVNGDATRLSQVLDNLLSNAIKFSEPGGTIYVSVEEAAAEGKAKVIVRDTGMGIEASMLSQIFEVFSQADKSLDRVKGGLGLGLSLVKGLVELHNGEVFAESAGLGQGAAFTVILPAEHELPALTAEGVPAIEAGQPLKILVVEDNYDSAESLRILLELLGHTVELAHDGIAGLNLAESFQPDLVICDIGLPGLDGFTLARELRQSPKTAAMRLIALTGYGREEERRRAEEAGFDAHLVKPASADALLRVLSPGDARNADVVRMH